jgi:hypothetical protein
VNSDKNFQEMLNKHTERLLERMIYNSSKNHPSENKNNKPSWGIARKVLNIFLFEATHNKILNKKYNLENIICYLEIPLDNPNAKELQKRAESDGKNLDWKNIKSLEPELNKKIQEYAEQCANQKYGWDRCYLELYFRDKH